MRTLARTAVRYRWFVIGGWIAFIIGVNVLSAGIGGAEFNDDSKLPGTETQAVADILKEAGLEGQNGFGGFVVVQSKTGSLTSAPAGLLEKLAEVCKADNKVVSIATPWAPVVCPGPVGNGPADPTLLSADKTTALVNVAWAPDANWAKDPLEVFKTLETLRSDSLRLEFTGDGFVAVNAEAGESAALMVGFVAALIILAVVFRTFGGTALPLLSAVAALSSGLALMNIASHGINVASFAPQLAELMVIGVGVDYALFIVTRHRRNLARGMSVDESIVLALDTSGRAVIFAGATVCIAILGLLTLGVTFLYGVAVCVSLAVGLTVVASITLLPAVLSLLGRRILHRSKREALPSDKLVKILLLVIPPVCFVFWVIYGLEFLLKSVRRRPSSAGHAAAAGPDFWHRWSALVEKRAVVLGVVAAGVIAVLAIPFFGMQLGHADQGGDSKSTTTRQGYDIISDKYGEGYNSVLQLVVSGPDADKPEYLAKVAAVLGGVPDVDKNSIAPYPAKQGLGFVGFKSLTSPQDEKTSDLIRHLRADVLPPVYEGSQNHVYVFGMTAIYVDFTKVLSSKMLLFMAAVVGLSFLLLMVAFRSLVIPATAAVMNLFAAGASFGITVAIFQWGWFSEFLGIGGGGPIEAFAPVMFFSILFGLSMDYQVFLVSRMHEEWIHTNDNRKAVTVGQAETGGIITAAALIMIAVFGGFLLGDDRVIKLFGIGLATAIFLDAFVLRTILVPAIMHLLGDANWFYPKALDRITPRLSIEPAEDPILEAERQAEHGDEPDKVLANA